jgi:hypothetical protein
MSWTDKPKNSASWEDKAKNSTSWSALSKKAVRSKFFSEDFQPFKDSAPFKENSTIIGTVWSGKTKTI